MENKFPFSDEIWIIIYPDVNTAGNIHQIVCHDMKVLF